MASPHPPDQYSPRTPSPVGSTSSSSSSSASSLPLLAITIVGILTTIILLVSYYVFVLKCRRTRGHPDDILRRLTGTGSGRSTPWLLPFTFFTTPAENHGLDESAIQSIPTIRYRSQDGRPFHECAVCLNDFKEEEKLRLLPGCSHAFHIDCIDTWLQFNANCPLCRLDITAPIPTHHQISTRATLDSPHGSESMVIDVQEDGSNRNLVRETPPKPGEPRSGSKKGRQMLRSMGDECIDVRNKDAECSAIQPIRRSFSMDSSADRQLYLSVQEILQKNEQQFRVQECGGGGGEEGGSSSSSGGAKIRRSFFSFGHGRSLRSTAVFPV